MNQMTTSVRTPETWTFGEFFSRYPAQVCVVTAQTASGSPTGSTCTAVMALSDNPASLLVSFMDTSQTLQHIRQAGEFGINAMGVGGQSTVLRFAGKGENKFADVAWHRPEGDGQHSGIMISTGVVAYAHCRVDQFIEVGDHTLVVGHIESIVPGDSETSVLYAQRAMWVPEVAPADV